MFRLLNPFSLKTSSGSPLNSPSSPLPIPLNPNQTSHPLTSLQVLYRFGSTGVVQVLSRAADLLGLVPVFPVRNIHTYTSGSASATAVFRDCVLVKKGLTVGDVYRKVMGDAPLAYVETEGARRVGEDDVVAVGKNDILSFKVGRA